MTKKQKAYQDLPQNTRKKIAQNATQWAKEKRRNGERATLTVAGRANEIATIRNAIALHGGNNIKALVEICQDFINNNAPKSRINKMTKLNLEIISSRKQNERGFDVDCPHSEAEMIEIKVNKHFVCYFSPKIKKLIFAHYANPAGLFKSAPFQEGHFEQAQNVVAQAVIADFEKYKVVQRTIEVKNPFN